MGVKQDDPVRASAALSRGWAETDDEWRQLKDRSTGKHQQESGFCGCDVALCLYYDKDLTCLKSS